MVHGLFQTSGSSSCTQVKSCIGLREFCSRKYIATFGMKIWGKLNGIVVKAYLFNLSVFQFSFIIMLLVLATGDIFILCKNANKLFLHWLLLCWSKYKNRTYIWEQCVKEC